MACWRYGRRRLRRGLAAWAIAGVSLLTQADIASGFDSRIDASFDAQLYDVTSPYGVPVLTRRRFTQTLSLSLYDMQGDFVSGEPHLNGAVRLRLDADLGIEGAEFIPGRQERFVPGVVQAPLDLMYGYVEGHGFFDGVLSFRAGRQYQIDPLGFWSFDGGSIEVATPAYFALTVLGGFEQRAGLRLLSTSRYEADGVYRGSRDDFATNQRSDFLAVTTPAPAWGFGIHSTGIPWLGISAAYRKVLNRDTVVVSPFLDERGGSLTEISELRTSSERLGAGLTLSSSALGTAEARSVYDLYLRQLTAASLGLDWHARSELSLGAVYDYVSPTFDGDSIFNWFDPQPMQTGQLRARWSVRRFSASFSPGLRRYGTDGTDGTGAVYDAMGAVEARYRLASTELGAQLSGQAGGRGHYAGGAVEMRRRYDNDTYDLLIRTSVYDWADELRPERDAISWTYVFGAGIQPFEATRAGFEWEHSINHLVGHRVRFLATLDVSLQ